MCPEQHTHTKHQSLERKGSYFKKVPHYISHIKSFHTALYVTCTLSQFARRTLARVRPPAAVRSHTLHVTGTSHIRTHLRRSRTTPIWEKEREKLLLQNKQALVIVVYCYLELYVLILTTNIFPNLNDVFLFLLLQGCGPCSRVSSCKCMFNRWLM